MSARKLIGYNGFLRFYVLDSRLRGNDESIRTETCTTSFLRTCTTSFPRTCIPSFPRKWESRISKASANL
ncbi:hypothetical protein COI20_11555 [Neisseria meningitidis]|nr:hypothetical protein COI20_11555 [Neisseria meningitidis]